ncbi:MAG TPA: discoidin domain-containing protein [Sedimentisphaerales bacterium]|nr:discoidin domain-containing protein [Sedimentisphaerales bacterium]
MFKKLLLCLILSLFVSQAALGDYVIISQGVPSVVRFTDAGEIVWETTTDPLSDLENPSQVEIGPDGYVYVAQGGWGANRTVKRFDYDTGELLGNVTEITTSDQQNDLQWGYDYNGDGVDDLWVIGRSDLIAVHDGTTLGNYPATLLDSWDFADTDPENQNWDGGGGRGLLVGPDITGDGVGELFMAKGYNDSSNKINVWDPVALKNGAGIGARVASYPATEIRESQGIILGPDVNGDGQQDLWVASQRRNEIRTYDYLTGEELSIEKAGITFRNMLDVDHGPDGTILMVSRFATSLDPDWTGGAEVTGGNVIKYDPVTGTATLVVEYWERVDSVAYVPFDISDVADAADPYPAYGATDVQTDVILSWTPGLYADRHDVYFGTDFNDVRDATATNDTSGVYKGRQDSNNYPVIGTLNLDLGETYYWRIDEVNAPPGPTYKGKIWSFTVEPVAYQISGENIIASASSSAPDQEPGNTVNGSGLDESGLLHGNYSAGTMWLSSLTGEQPTWIEYEFDKVYKLREMRVWNFNESWEQNIGLGFKEVKIEFSIDGADYTTLGTTHEFAQGPGLADYAHNTNVDFGGVPVKYVRLTANSNWGDILNQYGLSEVQFLYVPVQAREPYPDSGATDVAVDVVLSWRAGRQASEHDVYFSTDEQAVIDGSAPVQTVTGAGYGPMSLDLGQTYYWRVDEANSAESPAMWEGEVWSFTTQEFFVVDDFESYDAGDNQIWYSWIDGLGYGSPGVPFDPGNGTGAAVGDETTASYTEETIVHSGSQSMPLSYDNNKQGSFKYSEVEFKLIRNRDWTEHGIAALSLWFYGDPNNSDEPMYVAVADKTGAPAVVYHDDASARKTENWTEWRIPLQTFAEQGVILTDVDTIAIGFGTRGNTTIPGASGKMFIDDIRLHGQAPDNAVATMTGQLAGTLSTMSPEQAAGRPDLIDMRTDVYSLGVMLYHMLTGQYPYEVTGSTLQVLQNIQKATPLDPGRLFVNSTPMLRPFCSRPWTKSRLRDTNRSAAADYHRLCVRVF